jgi:hypothetical protein
LSGISEDDLERLASRLAMVVSEDGEAENAGRAMGQLARRLGLTGGHLKEIFLAGGGEIRATAAAADVERLQRELATLRHALATAEADRAQAERDRDELQFEVAALRTALMRRRGAARRRLAVGLVLLFAVLAVGAIAYVGTAAPSPQAPALAGASAGAPMRRVAMVRSARTLAYAHPSREAPVLATLPPGMPLVVHRLVWNMLLQWAEIELGSGTGYVLTTDIDLS